MNLPEKLGLIYLLSEIGVGLLRRSGRKSKRRDAGSLAVLWVTIIAAIAEVEGQIPAKTLRTLRLFGVTEFLHLQRSADGLG